MKWKRGEAAVVVAGGFVFGIGAGESAVRDELCYC
jgi:hypothetical protein